MEKSATYRWAWIIVLIILLGINNSCSEEIIEPESILEMNLNHNAADVIEDQYIILVSKHPAKKDRMAPAALEALSKEVGNMNGARIKGTFKHSVTGFVAKLNPQQVEKLKKDPRVISITADRYIELDNYSNLNPSTAVSVYENPDWGLDKIDQRAEKMDRAYVYNSTGTGVTAYVMDSGIRLTHEEFEGRAVLGIDMEFVIDPETVNPDQQPGFDCFGHGTHVAGSIGGKNFGVAKKVEIISVKVSPKCENRTPISYLIGGIDWITNHALINNKLPAVVNMSLGGRYTVDYDPLEYAIENSISSGLNYIISAGNANMNTCEFSPARVPGALSVGASDVSNTRARFSNYGNCLDLYAPGVSITSAVNSGDTDTRAYSGTSMSAPLVSGVVALYLEKNPDATPAEVHSAIVENSTPNFIGNVPSGPSRFVHSLWGPVNFISPTPPDLNLRAIGKKAKGSVTISLLWETTNDPYIIIYRNGAHYMRYYNNGEYTLNTNGKGNDTFQICEENYSNCSQIVSPDYNDDSGFEPNKPPTASLTYEIDGLQVKFTDTSTDTDGSIIARTWYFGDGYYSEAQNPIHTYAYEGTYKVELMVQDNLRAIDNITQNITVKFEDPNDPDPTDPDPPTNELVLAARGYKVKGAWHTDLSWTPAGNSEKVDIFRNGVLLARVNNTGAYTDNPGVKGGGSLIYKVCETGLNNCSNEVTVQF